jgi:hypothetical protein
VKPRRRSRPRVVLDLLLKRCFHTESWFPRRELDNANQWTRESFCNAKPANLNPMEFRSLYLNPMPKKCIRFIFPEQSKQRLSHYWHIGMERGKKRLSDHEPLCRCIDDGLLGDL